MDMTAAGLSSTEAKCYAALLERASWKPAELARVVSETRTNTYKILDKLVELGLATRFDKDKKLHYRAENPTRLLELARQQRQARDQAEKELEMQAQSLLATYFKSLEQPGVRYFQGKAGIAEMYDDQLRTNEPIIMVRSRADIDFFGGFAAMAAVRDKFNTSPIRRHMLTPDSPEVREDWREHDAASGNTRTWLQATDYTAAVEWAVYGDKVAFISFGAEAMGMIIESPQIAEAMRQLLGLIDRGQRLHPDYSKLPLRAHQKPV